VGGKEEIFQAEMVEDAIDQVKRQREERCSPVDIVDLEESFPLMKLCRSMKIDYSFRSNVKYALHLDNASHSVKKAKLQMLDESHTLHLTYRIVSYQTRKRTPG
jgi:hypothetical protein